MPAIRLTLVAIAACAVIATGTYFAFPFLQKQATFASGTINSLPLLSPIEKPSAPIVAIPNAEPAKQAEQAVTVDRKARRPNRSARVIPRTQQEAPNPVAAEPVQTGPQNYY